MSILASLPDPADPNGLDYCWGEDSFDRDPTLAARMERQATNDTDDSQEAS